MDVGKSVGYVFEDQKWTNKLLIGMLVSIVPIVNFALLGWVVDIMRNVSQRQPNPLPEWSDFGEKFVKGAILFVVGLIYSLPALLLTCPLPLGPTTPTRQLPLRIVPLRPTSDKCRYARLIKQKQYSSRLPLAS